VVLAGVPRLLRQGQGAGFLSQHDQVSQLADLDRAYVIVQANLRRPTHGVGTRGHLEQPPTSFPASLPAAPRSFGHRLPEGCDRKGRAKAAF
jgi:hypothetical protein